MNKKIDARGLSCPQPVIMAKKALDESGEVVIIVDNKTSVENVTRMGQSRGCEVNVDEAGGGIWEITLSGSGALPGSTSAVSSGAVSLTKSGPSVFVLSHDRMGGGNDELGYVLIKAFLHTLPDLENLPDTLILYNTGVKLAAGDSETIEDMKKLEELGVEILVCGTCTNFFDITEKIAAGKISNMYDIAGAMASSGRLVIP